ncbi:MAG: TnpV protein [Clostridia bacterium]|nr:TnpV protein [Clostridia bacterium]
MAEITYHKEGDYFVPDLYLEKEEYENDYIIGKYGHLRLEYLKNHKKAEYIIMFMNCTLRKHIVDTDKQAKEKFEMLMNQMLERNPIDENLKNTAPLKWTGIINNYKYSVEDIIFNELIYC